MHFRKKAHAFELWASAIETQCPCLARPEGCVKAAAASVRNPCPGTPVPTPLPTGGTSRPWPRSPATRLPLEPCGSTIRTRAPMSLALGGVKAVTSSAGDLSIVTSAYFWKMHTLQNSEPWGTAAGTQCPHVARPRGCQGRGLVGGRPVLPCRVGRPRTRRVGRPSPPASPSASAAGRGRGVGRRERDAARRRLPSMPDGLLFLSRTSFYRRISLVDSTTKTAADDDRLRPPKNPQPASRPARAERGAGTARAPRSLHGGPRRPGGPVT